MRSTVSYAPFQFWGVQNNKKAGNIIKTKTEKFGETLLNLYVSNIN